MNKAHKTNNYDRMAVDIEHIFTKEICPYHRKKTGYAKRYVKRYVAAALIYSGCYCRLVDAGFIRGWFEEFELYWSSVLNGRPLFLHDFFYLLGVYRQRYQDVEVQKGAGKQTFLASWQSRDTLYQLFGAVRRYAYMPLHCYRYEKWIRHGDSILEYGCGVAPVAYSLLNYSLKRDLKITIADIRQINSHYARWRLNPDVQFVEIEPYENSLPLERFNIVFMLTVMEHLPDPLATVRNITASLKSDGLFIFDYILSDGTGLDTIEAVQQRGKVLDHIARNYDLVSGKLSLDESMGTTICRRILKNS